MPICRPLDVRIGIKLALPTFLRLQGYRHQKQRDHSHVDGVHAGIRTTAAPVPGMKTLCLLTHIKHINTHRPPSHELWFTLFIQPKRCFAGQSFTPCIRTTSNAISKSFHVHQFPVELCSTSASCHLRITEIDLLILCTFCASFSIHE